MSMFESRCGVALGGITRIKERRRTANTYIVFKDIDGGCFKTKFLMKYFSTNHIEKSIKKNFDYRSWEK